MRSESERGGHAVVGSRASIGTQKTKQKKQNKTKKNKNKKKSKQNNIIITAKMIMSVNKPTNKTMKYFKTQPTQKQNNKKQKQVKQK